MRYCAGFSNVQVHKHEGDLFCLEGEVKFIYGGKMVNAWVKKNADGTEFLRKNRPLGNY